VKKSSVIVLVVAAFALSIAAVNLISPKSVKAAVAALIRDVDNQARHPFALACFSSSSASNSVSCEVAVPPGEEMVVQTVNLGSLATTSNTSARLAVSTTTAGNVGYADTVVQDDGFFQPFQSRIVGTLNTTLYADPGTNIVCSMQTKSLNSVQSLAMDCYLTGYYVTLP